MTALCIVTPPGFPTEPILAHVRAAGVEPITSAEGKIASIEAWQEQIRRVNPDPDEPLKIGTFWKQILTDFYLNTLECNCWGWHLGDDLRFLDFWHEFDPSIRFLLISVAPEFQLAYQWDNTAGAFGSTENPQWFGTWRDYHQKILGFYRNHTKQSLIIDLEELVSEPKETIAAINSQWPLQLSPEISVAPKSALPSPIAKLLIRTISSNLFPPEITTLKRELETSCITLSHKKQNESNDAVQAYRILCQTLESNRKEVDKVKKQAEEEKQRLLSQLNQIQAELKALKNEKQTIQQQHNKLEEANKTLQAAQKQLENKKKEIEEENELILLQLHQVQEELEHYFLQYKEAEQEITRWQSRWARMLERNPDFIDYERLTVEPDTNEHQFIWQFEKIDIAGRSLDQLNLRTQLDGETVHLTFQRENFIRWPLSADNTETLTISPESHQIIETLSTSDFTLIKALTQFLATHGLHTQEAAKHIDGPTRAALKRGLQQFSAVLEQLPPTFRYDHIELKREQINPDYEHLWFRFQKASFGKLEAPAFEFRLSCANVRPNAFGKYPKLEFPEGDGASLFEQWYEESWDDFSSKWELRFALPRSMDLEVWRSISEHDRALVRSLVNQLPIFFAELNKNGLTPKRKWKEWEIMTKNIKSILTRFGE